MQGYYSPKINNQSALSTSNLNNNKMISSPKYSNFNQAKSSSNLMINAKKKFE
jgi:hypothetical protein